MSTIAESSSPVAAKSFKSLLLERCYVDGRWIDADDGKSIDVINPANGERIARVPRMGAAETRRAIEAANTAWPAWRKRSAKERSDVLRRALVRISCAAERRREYVASVRPNAPRSR